MFRLRSTLNITVGCVAQICHQLNVLKYFLGVERSRNPQAILSNALESLMTRILIISNLYPPQALGGYERSIADFARILQHRGHRVRVLTSDTQEFHAEHSSIYPDPGVFRGLKLAGQWQQGVGAKWFPPDQAEPIFRQNVQEIDQHIQDFQPDIALVGNIDLLHTIPIQTLLAAQIPTVHYVMNATPGYAPELAPQTRLFQYVTCSNWVTQSLQKAGYPAATAQTVYPGAIVEEFYQAQLPPRDRLRIAYASLVMAYKGADVLLEALSILPVMDIPFSATIAGDTFDPAFVANLKEFVEAEGLAEHIQFTGVLSRRGLHELYKTHNVLVFPSRFQEPFGISQIEAMAAGLTLVTSGTGGAKEIIEAGQDALLFESENPLDLADKLAFLAANPQESETIARRGQAKAMNHFNQISSTAALEAVFQQLIAASNAH